MTAVGAVAQSLPGWSLVWQDEFTQADGTAPSPLNWGYDLGATGWGNGELQEYTSSLNNARITNGMLVIEARRTISGPNTNYTSARLLTKNKWTWTYGRMEARIKVPYGQGIWPAFWMLGDNIGSVGWPNCGEIDIMEYIGREPQTVYGTIHGPGYSGGASFGGSRNLGVNVTDDFHVFVVEWETNRIRWYVDNTLYHTATPSSVAPNNWVFDHPHFFLLNVAVGGQWPGYPDGTTVFPQQMLVDYVRVYAASNAPDPEPPAGTNALINPGFESGVLSPWIGYVVGDANSQGTYVESTNNTYYNGGAPGGAGVLTHSGAYAGKIFGDFTGAENFNGSYQDFSATPGSRWQAGGWALTHAQDLMAGANTSWLEVSFRNEAGTILALYTSKLLTSLNVAVGSWMPLAVTNQLDPVSFQVTNTTSTLTAPVGTSRVRYQLVFRQQPSNDGGAMYFDDLSLVRVPELLPTVLDAVLAGNLIHISFATQPGVNYAVVQKTAITDPDWTPIETIAGDGTTKSVLYPASEPARYYALIQTL